MTRLITFRFSACLVLLGTALFVNLHGKLSAADPNFVGVLAMAVEDEGIKRLELSEETLEKLLAFIGQREEKVVNLVQQIRGLSPAEQEAKLRPFREESEKLAMQLLTVTQREILNQMRIASKGMDSLVDPQIAAVLTLTKDQQESIKKLLAQRTEALTQGNDEQQNAVRLEYEDRLSGILTAEQRGRWEKLSGVKLVEQVAQKPADTDTTDKPADTDTTDKPAVAETRRVGPDGKIQVRFNFRYAPWKDVLDWFASTAELSLQMDYPLQGTFNYIDKNYYSPDQAIDVMNGVLLTKGFTLIRRQKQLLMVNLEDTIPDVWVEFVTLENLADHGHYEIVKCLFQLDKMTAEEAEADLQKLLGPMGKISVFPAAKQLLIQETGGQLRRIQTMIESVEKPRQAVTEPVTEMTLKFITAESILPVARVLMGLNEEENRGEDISMAVDPLGTRIFATGSDENLAILKDLIMRLDIDPGTTASTQQPTEQPQLMTHPIQVANPDTTYEVLQTLLQGLPDINMTLDSTTNKIIARAPPSAQRIIQETIRELEGEVPQFEIISLKVLDPTVALAMIGNMFGGDPEAENPTGPKVTADPITMKLFVRATRSEIDAIQQMITRLETENTADNGGNLRLLPYTGSSALEALQRAERFWTEGNQIRIVTPDDTDDTSIFELRETSPGQKPAPQEPEPSAEPENERDTRNLPPATSRKPVSSGPQKRTESAGGDKTTQVGSPIHFVSQLQAPAAPAQKAAAKQPAAQSPGAQAAPTNEKPKSANPEIRVELTPNGILVYCEDKEVLDRFEQLLRQIAPPSSAMGQRKITVFYLKYIKADIASSMVQQVLSGGDTATGGVGSLMTDMTSNLLGGGGGLMGMLLGGGGGGAEASTTSSFQASGTVSIVPDVRLNALIVQANAEDVETVSQLLKVIDKESSETSVQTKRKPRLIPVIYTSAENIAAVIKEVYADRISGGSSRGSSQSRQPSPEEFMRALRGGGSRGGASSRGGAKAEEPKMTVGVDAQSNSLVVSAPDQLFDEVEDLVRTIDQAGTQTNDTTVVRTLKFSNPAMIQKALTSILGEAVTTSTTSGTGSSRTGSSRTGSSRTGTGGGDQATSESIRRRMEFFQQLQSGGAGGSSRGA
ncbi:MAG: hypothetical protein OSB47_08900, partial [Pirellulaceae bacterium]|nr:hypothetical protein [Pirellulaceae bacterium]